MICVLFAGRAVLVENEELISVLEAFLLNSDVEVELPWRPSYCYFNMNRLTAPKAREILRTLRNPSFEAET